MSEMRGALGGGVQLAGPELLAGASRAASPTRSSAWSSGRTSRCGSARPTSARLQHRGPLGVVGDGLASPVRARAVSDRCPRPRGGSRGSRRAGRRPGSRGAAARPSPPTGRPGQLRALGRRPRLRGRGRGRRCEAGQRVQVAGVLGGSAGRAGRCGRRVPIRAWTSASERVGPAGVQAVALSLEVRAAHQPVGQLVGVDLGGRSGRPSGRRRPPGRSRRASPGVTRPRPAVALVASGDLLGLAAGRHGPSSSAPRGHERRRSEQHDEGADGDLRRPRHGADPCVRDDVTVLTTVPTNPRNRKFHMSHKGDQLRPLVSRQALARLPQPTRRECESWSETRSAMRLMR